MLTYRDISSMASTMERFWPVAGVGVFVRDGMREGARGVGVAGRVRSGVGVGMAFVRSEEKLRVLTDPCARRKESMLASSGC
jgi:hypothetical protein